MSLRGSTGIPLELCFLEDGFCCLVFLQTETILSSPGRCVCRHEYSWCHTVLRQGPLSVRPLSFEVSYGKRRMFKTWCLTDEFYCGISNWKKFSSQLNHPSYGRDDNPVCCTLVYSHWPYPSTGHPWYAPPPLPHGVIMGSVHWWCTVLNLPSLGRVTVLV